MNGLVPRFLILFVLVALPFSAQGGKGEWQVDFSPPEGFAALPAQEVAVRPPGAQDPVVVAGGPSRFTTISYYFQPGLAAMPKDQKDVEEVATVLKRNRQVTELIDARLETINGRQWVYYEMITRGLESRFHNIMLSSSLGDEAIVFNFNSTVEEFPLVERLLRQSVRTIAVRRH